MSAEQEEVSTSNSSTPSKLFLPDSVPDEFKSESFFSAIRAAKITLGSIETGLSAKSEFELYFETGSTKIDISTLHKRAQNVDIRYSKIRSAYWKIFLSYINTDKSTWKSSLNESRNKYSSLKHKYIDNIPQEDSSNLANDNPLASATGGTWDKYFQDNQLRDTITLDIDRTYPENDFFVNKIVQNSLTDILFVYCKENEWISYKQGMNEIIALLFMINTVQSTISPYVDDDTKINQKNDDNDGNDDDDDSKPTQNGNALKQNEKEKETPSVSLWESIQDIRYIEHDTYFMFTEIMSIMGQYFINAAGSDVPPVVERSKRIQGQFLRQMDTQLAQHLAKINLTPQLYGLRWIRLFFSREFHLRDVAVVWDSIFACYSDRKNQKELLDENNDKLDDKNNNKLTMNPLKAVDNALEKPRRIKLDFRFVDYMSCSMLLFIRHQLIGRDISHCLRRVMRYPPVEDVASLIERGYTIRDQIERRGKQKKTKQSIGSNLNIADRWNQFSRNVSSAMTSYAEDVKNLMGGQRRTLKSRMQFEHALGDKMGQVLDRVQLVINQNRKLLNAAFNNDDKQSPPATTTNEIKSDKLETDTVDIDKEEDNDDGDNGDDNKKEKEQETTKEEPKEKEIAILDDPLSSAMNVSSVVDDPLGALTENNKKVEEIKQNDDDNKKEENALLIIEEALAELKLVKDALLGNLDETQLESWLDWTFVEPSPEPSSSSSSNRNKNIKNKINKYQSKIHINRKKPSPPHRRNLSSSGLPPPKSPNLSSSSRKNNITSSPSLSGSINTKQQKGKF